MKKLLTTIIGAALLVPLSVGASIPAFPMAFYGTIEIDNVPAPVDTIVRVYDAEVLVGEVTVQEVGMYGYDNPVKQKLIVEESTGELTFTIQSSNINSGVETGGLVTVTHPGFVSGETVQKNLNVILTESAESDDTESNVSSGSGRSGGGGGGGSSSRRSSSTEEPEAQVLGETISDDSETRIEMQKQIIALLTQIIALLQKQILLNQS